MGMQGILNFEVKEEGRSTEELDQIVYKIADKSKLNSFEVRSILSKFANNPKIIPEAPLRWVPFWLTAGASAREAMVMVCAFSSGINVEDCARFA